MKRNVMKEGHYWEALEEALAYAPMRSSHTCGYEVEDLLLGGPGRGVPISFGHPRWQGPVRPRVDFEGRRGNTRFLWLPGLVQYD